MENTKQDFIDNYITEKINIGSIADLDWNEREIVTFCSNIALFCRCAKQEKPVFINLEFPAEMAQKIVEWIEDAREYPGDKV